VGLSPLHHFRSNNRYRPDNSRLQRTKGILASKTPDIAEQEFALTQKGCRRNLIQFLFVWIEECPSLFQTQLT
jgi:hypothetical protein